MWYLIDLATNQKTPFLLSNRSYKVGRKNPPGNTNAQTNDIQIESDLTVSRTHAEILIKFDEKHCDDVEQRAHVVLTDNSKFGTFVNDIRVDGFKQLNPNDVIRFGVNNTNFKLCTEPLIVTTSCISQLAKSSIRKLVSRLSGYLVNDWRNDCSFVVMDEITVTVKCINALLCQRLIVTHKYLEDLVQICSNFNTSVMPDPNDYLPPVGESNLNANEISFKPCEKRKHLFKNKKFIFLSNDQLQKVQNIIELAGGKCEMLSKSTHLMIKNIQANKNIYLFLNDPSNKSFETQTNIQTILDGLEQRLIDDTEIGLAILYSSVKEYCNASYIPEDQRQVKQQISKMCSQTQDFMPDSMNYDDDEEEEDKQAKKRHLFKQPCEILDSEQIQFENKCIDMLIVTETQDVSLNKNYIIDTSLNDSNKEPDVKISKKSNDTQNDVFEEPFFTKKVQKISPLDEVVIEEPEDTMSFLKGNDQSTRLDQQSFSANKTFKSPKVNSRALKETQDKSIKLDQQTFSVNKTLSKTPQVDSQQSLISNNTLKEYTDFDDSKDSQLTFTNNKTLKESNTDIRRKAPITSTYKTIKPELLKSFNVTKIKGEDSCHERLPSKIYSKDKPPKESFMVKTESQEEPITSSNLIKIKFESLVKKEFKYDISTTSGIESTNGKVNFKKFRKVPKNLSKTNEKKTLFKSFKDEPFDVDSQFDQFMSSMR